MINEIDKQFMPKFLGIGSAFNTKLGNTSCYFYDEKNNKLTLIDCGWDVYSKLIKQGLLESKPDIIIRLTHTHGDHIGSLTTLLEHSFYVNKKKCFIKSQRIGQLRTILDGMLVDQGIYDVYDCSCDENQGFRIPHIIRNDIVDSSFAHFISDNKDEFIFAWDSAGVSSEIYNRFVERSRSTAVWYKRNTVYLFHDCCLANYPGNVHTYYKLLLDLVPEELRPNVFPVHIDDEKVLDIMVEAGFGDVRKLLV